MTAASSATASQSSVNIAASQAPSRVVSIDVFRGLTMAVMIFVNELADVRGLPWWTYHAHANEDVMTYVDMVFPFFLFIVGMSLPLSVTQRLKRNPSELGLWLHVLLRAASLVGLGLILANAEKADASRMGMSGNLWALLGLICGALYLNVYPASTRFPTYAKILRGIGLCGVVVLFAIFRRTTHTGQVAWIDPSYPEILGLIGFSYLAVAVLYIPTRRWRWSPIFWFIAMLLLCILGTAKILPWVNHWPIYFWPFSNGSMACIIMAGAATSQIFIGAKSRPAPRRAMILAAGFAVAALIAGWLCTPLGISKIRATPTWCLYSIAAAVLAFTLLYWVCDVKHRTAWAFPVRAAGANTLLTYLLPDLWYFLFASLGVTYLDTHFNLGWLGIVKTVIFTFVILALASALTKAKLRLQL